MTRRQVCLWLLTANFGCLFLDLMVFGTAVSEEAIKVIYNWLQPTKYDIASSSEYLRHVAAQAPGTELWVRQSSQYQTWRDSQDQGTFWIKAIPGAGKSVLAASLVSETHFTGLHCPLFLYSLNHRGKP